MALAPSCCLPSASALLPSLHAYVSPSTCLSFVGSLDFPAVCAGEQRALPRALQGRCGHSVRAQFAAQRFRPGRPPTSNSVWEERHRRVREVVAWVVQWSGKFRRSSLVARSVVCRPRCCSWEGRLGCSRSHHVCKCLSTLRELTLLYTYAHVSLVIFHVLPSALAFSLFFRVLLTHTHARSFDSPLFWCVAQPVFALVHEHLLVVVVFVCTGNADDD